MQDLTPALTRPDPRTHLKRYLGEFDFRYNTRDVTDMERTELAAQGIVGKRLTYRRTGLKQQGNVTQLPPQHLH